MAMWLQAALEGLCSLSVVLRGPLAQSPSGPACLRQRAADLNTDGDKPVTQKREVGRAVTGRSEDCGGRGSLGPVSRGRQLRRASPLAPHQNPASRCYTF